MKIYDASCIYTTTMQTVFVRLAITDDPSVDRRRSSALDVFSPIILKDTDISITSMSAALRGARLVLSISKPGLPVGPRGDTVYAATIPCRKFRCINEPSLSRQHNTRSAIETAVRQRKNLGFAGVHALLPAAASVHVLVRNNI